MAGKTAVLNRIVLNLSENIPQSHCELDTPEKLLIKLQINIQLGGFPQASAPWWTLLTDRCHSY